MHLEKCADCHTIPPTGLNRFLVKDSETRESIHILAATSQEAAVKTGWANPLFALMVEMGSPPETEEKLATKKHNVARLLVICKEKKNSFKELKNERSANRAAKCSSRPVDEQEKGDEKMSKKTKTSKSKKSSKARETHGTIFGSAPTAVLRWMGKNGFIFSEAVAALRAVGDGKMPTVGTIRAQLYHGKAGTRGNPASLTAEQQKTLRDAAKNIETKEGTSKAA